MSYSSQRLEAQVVPFYRLNVVIPSEPPVAVHDKSNMLWNWTLLERANEQFPQLSHRPCDRW
jgi:hypothetical protein